MAERILICLHDFAAGGTERIAVGLGREWARMGRKVTILSGDERGVLGGNIDPAVETVLVDPRVPRGIVSRLHLGAKMGRYLSKLRPHIIFLPGNYHLFLARGLKSAGYRAPVLLKLSNPLLPEGFSGAMGRLTFKKMIDPIDGFAALTKDFAREIASLAPHKPALRLRDPIFVKDQARAHAQEPEAFHVLWAGRLEPQKDVGLALTTIAALEEKVHLTILGEGSLAKKTDAMIKVMKLSHRVIRVGHVSNIDTYLARARALLLTSHYEGQPAVVGEALAHGVPVVSTDSTSMLREVMTIPEAGHVVTSRRAHDLAAALRDVLNRPRPEPQKLAALVSAFQPQICAKAYLDWFDCLLEGFHAH